MYCVNWEGDKMTFYIDDELLQEFASLVSRQSGTLTSNVTSIESAVDNGFTDWVGESKEAFVGSCHNFYPAIETTSVVLEAYAKVAQKVTDAASKCIEDINSAMNSI